MKAYRCKYCSELTIETEVEEIELEETEVWVCTSCEHATNEEPESPLYCCGECGTMFTRDSSHNGNHQCPNCNKFASKEADWGCPECTEAEMEKRGAFIHPDNEGEFILAEE